MTIYKRVWSVLVLVFGFAGAVEALLAVAPVVVWAGGISAGVASALAYFAYLAHQNRERGCVWGVLLAAGAGALGAVVLAGLAALFDGVAVVVVMAILCCAHPRVLAGAAGWAKRWLQLIRGRATSGTTRARPPEPSQPHDDASRSAPGCRASTRPQDWASKVIPRTPPPDGGWPDAAAMRLLSESQLCWGWRVSFTALQRTDPLLDRRRWATLIAVRQSYLDEIARRDPAGFARWLYSGARPASDPTRYLSIPPGQPTPPLSASVASLDPDAPPASEGPDV